MSQDETKPAKKRIVVDDSTIKKLEVSESEEGEDEKSEREGGGPQVIVHPPKLPGS